MDATMSPEEFGQQVSNVLRHIQDHVYLQNHPLCIALTPDPTAQGPCRAQRLRRLILEAIEGLSPPADTPLNSREWRGYHILTSRYVEGQDLEQIMAELAISERQFYREHRVAAEALTKQLWEVHQWVMQQRRAAQSEATPDHAESSPSLVGEVERVSLEPETVELHALLQGVLSAIQPLVRESQVHLSFMPADNLPMVAANRTVLRQVFIQILSTFAVQQDVSRVIVTPRPVQRRILLEITAATLTGARHTTLEALTLGTKQSRHLIAMLKGTWLGLESDEDRYVLRFALPTTQPRLLLAIEDNPSAVRLLQRCLAQHHYQVVAASTCAEALRIARELKPDVITLDIMLPHQDGWEVLQALQIDAATRHIPVIMSSVLDESALASAMGASAYLKKPYSQAQLLDVLQSLGTDRRG
ncbi:MAG: response regulator [Anaerolineae bacterium]